MSGTSPPDDVFLECLERLETVEKKLQTLRKCEVCPDCIEGFMTILDELNEDLKTTILKMKNLPQ